MCSSDLEYQLVIVREAQLVANIDLLTNYAKNPLASTILVIEYKYKKLDGRKSLSAAVAKTGVLFDSKKIPDYKIEDYISSVLRERAFEADRKAATMLSEYEGMFEEWAEEELGNAGSFDRQGR